MEREARSLLDLIQIAGYCVEVDAIEDAATRTIRHRAVAFDDDGELRIVTAPTVLQALTELSEQLDRQSSVS